ncbi:AfsR/SARP family transcriptional regulator [Streptomyces sp. CA-250714]|uniref:AfsR/SARP family transcriptional regulator n=1 Tax=Streptomyces sp. CA-250714 TaxID=3240060 RepID=UPI003D949C9D
MNVSQKALRFAVLGPVQAWRAEQELPLGPPQQRAVLAALLLRRGRPATTDDLIDALWGQEPPTGALTVLRTYISRLRKALEPGRDAGEAPRVIASAAGGYRIRIPEDALDLGVFERRMAEAKKLHTAGDFGAAAELLHAALELWDGTPLAGLPGPLAESERYRLDELRLTALETRLEIDLRLGRHEGICAELRSLADEYPLRERLSELLMLALYRSGRQAEALTAYRKVRDTLVAELGVEPGPSLADLHSRILNGEPSLSPPDPAEPAQRPTPAATSPAPHPPAPSAVRPAQLPADLTVFTGRDSELARSHALLPSEGQYPAAVVISAIGGMAGVGKTTLAVRWAHEIAHRFPDGQLYVNLRGFSPTGSAMLPDEAVHTFLEALGVSPEQMPSRTDARIALYRSMLADRRVLVLLDNARDTEQVRPLLPTGPGCLAIVTSRNRLSGLIANDGARPLTLSPLSHAEAREFLASRIGAERLVAEPEAADDLVTRCARLPLALAIVAVRATTHPSFPLRAIADELRDSHGSLDAFASGDIGTDVRAVFSWSYHALSAPAARLFRLLATHPGPDVSAPAAAALAGLGVRETRGLLGELTHAHLLTEHFPGRYVFHDLVRVYAAECADAEEAAAHRDRAVEQVLTWYLHTADAASQLITPQRPRVPLPPPPADCRPLEFTAYDHALDWCTTERPNLVAAIRHAATYGHPGLAWRLTAALWGFFYLRNHAYDWIATTCASRDAARSALDRQGEAESLTNLANALTVAGNFVEAIAAYEEALPIWQELGDDYGVLRVKANFGDLYLRAGRFEEALDHIHSALADERARGDTWGEGVALHNLGEACLRLGRLEEARDYLEQGLVVQRASDNRWVEGGTLDHLGTVCHRLERHTDAIGYYERALRTHRDVGNEVGVAQTLDHLADVRLAMGEPDAARTDWGQALKTLEEFSHPDAVEIRDKLSALDDARGG